MSIFPRPLKKVLGKIIPFSKEDKIPTFNLGSGVADSTTVLHGDGTWSDDFDHIDFNQFPIAGGAERRMRWNDADGTVDLGLKGGNVTLQLGQENLARVVNKTSPLIDLLESNYQVVRISGATGQRLSVRLALADNDINSATTIGIVTENIPKNQEGFITTFGLVRDINTTGSLQGETWVDGDILYLSGTVPGQLTNIKPSAPTHLIVVGYVEYAHANHGKIFVKVDNGYELDELHNVSIPTTPTNGQVLTFNGTSGLWEAQTVPTGITVGTTPVTSGTDGRVFFQSGGVVQQDSSFFWDNTNKRLGVGTSTPQARLDVRVQGALLTDVAFRVRNSAGSFNLLSIHGDGGIYSRMNTATQGWQTSSSDGVHRWELGFIGNLPFIAVGGQDNTPRMAHKAVTDNREYAFGLVGTRANMALGQTFAQGTVKPNEANNNTFYVFNGTAPTLSATDSFSLYSADRGGTAGKASAHFRAEDGTINVIGDLSGFGTSSPGARLDVRAQGALSTDLILRTRNSADTRNFLVVNGAGDVYNNGAGGVTSNTFYGENVGRSASGVQNTAFGNLAAQNLSTGTRNTIIGQSCGVNVTTGVQNVFMGWGAGSQNIGGSSNVIIGDAAGRFFGSGTSNLTTVNNSIIIGQDARANANSETNQIVIGTSAIGTGSNSVTLGNTSITQTNLRGQVVISGFASAPTGVEGAIYYDSTTKKHYGFDGTTWNALY